MMLQITKQVEGMLTSEVTSWLSGRPLHLTVQGHGQGQTWWSLRPLVQSICVLFILWQSNHFWLRYNKFHTWPWKFKVKVMVEVKSDGHIWGLEFNRYVCFLFRGNWTIFVTDIDNIWPWKFRVKVMAKVKFKGHFGGLEFNQYICFLFRGNQILLAKI